MKPYRSLPILIILLILANTSAAQKITVGSHIEKNIKGTQFGLSTSFITQKKFGVGIYHQMEISRNAETGNNYNELSGFLIDFPLVKDTKINVIGRLKPSLADKQFILLIPAIETQVTLFNFFQIAGEVSYRAGYPAVAIKSNLNVNLKK